MQRLRDDPGRRLRPVQMSTILEISTRLLRRHWAILLTVSVLVGLPGALLGAVAGIPFADALLDVLPADRSSVDVTVSDAQMRRLGEGLVIVTAGSLVAGILAAIAAVGFAWVVARDYHGRPASLGDTLTRSVSRVVPALLTGLLAGLATLGLLVAGALGVAATLALLAPDGASGGGLGVFLAIVVGVVAFIAIVVVGVRWALAMPIVAIEDVGPVTALRRSWHLTGAATWRTFGMLLVVNLVVGILSTVVAQLLAIVIVDLLAQPADMTLAGQTIVDTLVTMLFAPVGTVVMTVYLYDQMVRRDGFDLPAPGEAAEAVPSPWGPGAP